MLILDLQAGLDVIRLNALTNDPDENWTYTRSDGQEVRWNKVKVANLEGGHHHVWRIFGLDVKTRPAKPIYDQGEQINAGEVETYYADPTNDEEVEPGYVTREKTHHVAGPRTVPVCNVLLTDSEKKWLMDGFKQSVVAKYGPFDNDAVLLEGVWLYECSQDKWQKEAGVWFARLSVDTVTVLPPAKISEVRDAAVKGGQTA